MADPIVALKALHEKRDPYEGIPRDAKLSELDKKLSTPAGIARLALETLMAVEAPGQQPTPSPGMTPRAFDAAARRYERRIALARYKRAMFPLIEVYVEDMQANPDLTERNSMAAATLLAILFTDDWRHVTKSLGQLQSIFGHQNLVVTAKRDKAPVEDRIKAIVQRAVGTVQRLSSTVAEARGATGS
jgi:hypothetical protein